MTDERVSRPFSRLLRAVARIRTKLLLANLLLVIVPVAGLSFARTYERELLRSEEEGMVVVAKVLAANAGDRDAAKRAAEELHAQVRLLDAKGEVTLDTGAPEVEKVTRGRELISWDGEGSDVSYLRRAIQVRVSERETPKDAIATRPEVVKAMQGNPGRATRLAETLRSVLLYVAEPVRGADGQVVGVVYVTRSTYPVLVSLYRVRNSLWRVLAVSSGLALVVAIFLALTISRPLRKLTLAAGRIAHGERRVSLDLRGRDEVGDLARAFDRMARELDARLDYASELAANVSHEFKTPLASLKGAAELLRDGAAEDPKARDKFLGNIVEDAERLSRLVSRLLELSRVEASHGPGAPLDYLALVNRLVDRGRSQGATIQVDLRCEQFPMVGHTEQLESVLQNLLDNAARYAPAGTAIEVRVFEKDRGLTTEIQDRGAGISQANLALIWDRFFTTERARGGSGLGLPIAKAIVEAHGGHIEARSIEGRGTTISFWFPRSR